MQNIQLNIFNVDVPAWGGIFRNIYLMNSPEIDYSFHLFENLEKEQDKFLANMQKILAYEIFEKDCWIEISFDRMIKMPVASNQENFIDLNERQQNELIELLNKNFPNNPVVIVTIS